MPFRIRVSLAILLGLFTLLLVGPLITPVRPLNDTVSVDQLADKDSQFVRVNNLDIHYKTAGNPESKQTFLLLHGFGAHTYTWHELMSPLAERGFVIAFDRPAFGLTERPLQADWGESNPYTPAAQLELVQGLIKALAIDKAVFVGHSAGGKIAVEFALEHPESVEALVLLDATIFNSGGPQGLTKLLLFTPQMNRIGPLFMRQFGSEPGLKILRASWANPDAIDDETLAAYQKPLQVDHWDKALWELSKANQSSDLAKNLGELTQPALVLTGIEDKTVPVELSQRLADNIPNADYVTFEGCGHVPQEECPEAVLTALLPWLDAQGF